MNLASWIVLVLLLVLITFVLRILKKEKKSGHCSCGGSCGHCAMNCHGKSHTIHE